VGKRLLEEMAWYDNYLSLGQTDRSANPSPGNKKGGLANVVEKALGSIAKSGTSAISEVLSPGQRPTKKGLIYAATPASAPCLHLRQPQLVSSAAAAFLELRLYRLWLRQPGRRDSHPLAILGTRSGIHQL